MEPNTRQFFCQHLSATLQLLRKALMTQTLHFFLSSGCCKTVGKTGVSTSPSKVAAWQVKYGTKLSPIFLPTCVSNIATFKKSTYDDPSIAFFPFQQLLQNRRKNRFFQHPFQK